MSYIIHARSYIRSEHTVLLLCMCVCVMMLIDCVYTRFKLHPGEYVSDWITSTNRSAPIDLFHTQFPDSTARIVHYERANWDRPQSSRATASSVGPPAAHNTIILLMASGCEF